MMKFKIQKNLHNHILADECSNNHTWDLKIDSLSSSNLLIKIKMAVNKKLKQMKDEWIKLYIWKAMQWTWTLVYSDVDLLI